MIKETNNNIQSQELFQRPPKTWLVESILVTILCCLPFGIAGIVNASKVESLFYAGDYDGALRASREAGKWTKIGFWIGIVYVFIILFITIGSLFVTFLSEY